MTPSQLRQNIYRLIDRVLETGEPLEIHRKGRRLRLVPDEAGSNRLAAIHTNPDVVVGDPEALVSVDWAGEWEAERQVHP